MENLTIAKRQVCVSEFSEMDVDVAASGSKCASFGDLLAVAKSPELKAIQRHKITRQPNGSQSGDLITTDESGRSYVTTDTLKKLDEQQKMDVAMLEHGNDPHKRMDICGFPRKSEYRLRFMAMDYERQYPKAFNALNQGHWLFIHGPRGTGKTTLACHMGWKYLEKHPTRKAKFISVISWLDGMRPDSEREEAVALPYLPPFVILDDLEKYQNTDWQKLRLFDLVDHLYRRSDHFHVVITSNKSLAEIDRHASGCTRIGPALDRIREMALQISLAGPSMRRNPEI